MSTVRPYVDQRITDVHAARAVADAAAAGWGLGPPVLLRHGMNAIYEIGDEVLRVGRATALASASHDLADVLTRHGVPVVRPVPGHAADIDGFAVTGWQRIEPLDVAVDWSAVGSAVARIHSLDVASLPITYPVPSPTAFPWWDFDTLLASVGAHIDDAARAGLERTIEAGRSWRSSVGTSAVVCHGDVHPGNVLITTDGPVLIDFDLLCRAAPAWDHAMLTTVADRWGGDPAVYSAFADGYGRSLVDDDLATTLGALRNVAATLMRVRAGLTDPSARAEAERRLRWWRGDPDAPQWRAQ